MRDINLAMWLPIYMDIARRLGLDPERDRYATRLLDKLACSKVVPQEDLEQIIQGREVYILGNGPNLPEDLRRNMRAVTRAAVIAADAASIVYKSVVGRPPDIVVTDLDGPVHHMLKLNSILVVHAHGDNIHKLRRHVPEIPALHPTTQVEPIGCVHNYGGFTDGDRAAYLAYAFGASCIKLLGMCFTKPSSYDLSSRKDIDRKMLKLEIARWLLEHLRRELKANVVDLSGVC